MWGEYDYETTQDYLEKTTKTNFLQKITQDKSRQIITAGGRNEISQEKAEWGHSAFTKNLLSGLRDSKADINTDGYITSQELGSYLKKKVTIDTNKKQTPKIRDLSTDEGEFVFVLSEDTAVIEDESIDTISLADIMSEVKELKTQSISDKNTKLDLKVDSALQQSGYPLTYSWIWSPEGYLWGTIMKQQDKRAILGLGLGHIRYADDWAGEFVDVTEFAITPFVGYYLAPRKTPIFNPLIRLSLNLNNEKRKCETLQLHDTGEEFNIALALINEVHINEDFGFSFGLEVNRAGIQEFNDDGDLYVDRYEFMYYPVITMDNILLKKYYGPLSDLNRITLRQRKNHDLQNFIGWYLMSNLGGIWYGDRIYPLLLIPAIGPFLHLASFASDEGGRFGWENIHLLTVVNQTYFLFDYIRTSKKLKGLNNNISYQINLHPIAPSVKFTYDFD
jgi:hypothetical protein